jgi:hypothetical protein
MILRINGYFPENYLLILFCITCEVSPLISDAHQTSFKLTETRIFSSGLQACAVRTTHVQHSKGCVGDGKLIKIFGKPEDRRPFGSPGSTLEGILS